MACSKTPGIYQNAHVSIDVTGITTFPGENFLKRRELTLCFLGHGPLTTNNT